MTKTTFRVTPTGIPIFDTIIVTVIVSSKIGMKIALDITKTHIAIGSHMTESDLKLLVMKVDQLLKCPPQFELDSCKIQFILIKFFTIHTNISTIITINNIKGRHSLVQVLNLSDQGGLHHHDYGNEVLYCQIILYLSQRDRRSKSCDIMGSSLNALDDLKVAKSLAFFSLARRKAFEGLLLIVFFPKLQCGIIAF